MNVIKCGNNNKLVLLHSHLVYLIFVVPHLDGEHEVCPIVGAWVHLLWLYDDDDDTEQEGFQKTAKVTCVIVALINLTCNCFFSFALTTLNELKWLQKAAYALLFQLYYLWPE